MKHTFAASLLLGAVFLAGCGPTGPAEQEALSEPDSEGSQESAVVVSNCSYQTTTRGLTSVFEGHKEFTFRDFGRVAGSPASCPRMNGALVTQLPAAIGTGTVTGSFGRLSISLAQHKTMLGFNNKVDATHALRLTFTFDTAGSHATGLSSSLVNL